MSASGRKQPVAWMYTQRLELTPSGHGGLEMRCVSLLMLAASAASYAEDPFSCVDPDVADAFLGNSYQGQGKYSTSIPGGFATLNVPGGLSLVGSKIADSMTTVVYKASMDPGPALDAAVGAMAQSGWAESKEQQ